MRRSPISSPRDTPSRARGNNGSPLQLLREEKGISQRRLAQKLGCHRSRLRRLEKTPWKEVSLGNLEELAQALGIEPAELFVRFNGFDKKEVLTRSHLEKPAFSLELDRGVRLSSYLICPEPCFIGSLTLPPRKGLSRDKTPRGELVFYLVLEGELLVTFSAKELLFKKGECFSIESSFPYSLDNPHPFKELRALLVSLPSFIHPHPPDPLRRVSLRPRKDKFLPPAPGVGRFPTHPR